MAESKKEKKNDLLWGLLPSIMGKMVGAVEDFAQYFLNAAESTAHDLLRKGIEKLVSFFLIAVGTLFLAVGVAAFLSEYYQVAGVGPLIVGAAFLLIGLFFMLSRRD